MRRELWRYRVGVTPCRRSSRPLVRLLVVGALVAVACPQVSEAKCHAADFKLSQIQAVAKEVDSSVENLAALVETVPANIRAADFGFLLQAADAVKAREI
jgi:uncharacterized protein YgbK (DUF1537 family)